MIEPGAVIHDRYVVIQKLGNGSFGQTFEVEDRLGVPDGDPGTPKVMKILDISRFSDSKDRRKAVSLFQREAEVLQRLDHSQIPKVDRDGYFRLETQDSPELLHCLIMEKITGDNLKDWLQNNQPITEAQAIDWLKQLVGILDAIHKNNYFHRDIKPENIMLKPDGKLVLIDFGAVREVTETYMQQRNDRSGTAIGSFIYMPPEQNNGQARPQSDFFALGRTLVHLLTGESFDNIEDNSQTRELIWRNEAQQVSDDLADFIDWLMEPDWRNRPQSLKKISEELEAIEHRKRGVYSHWSSLPFFVSVFLNFVLLGHIAGIVPLTEGLLWFLFVVAVVIAISGVFKV